MEQCIEDNGKQQLKADTGMVYKFGQTVQNMKVTGQTTKLMVKVNFGMRMAMCLMENGKRTKHMAMVFTLT